MSDNNVQLIYDKTHNKRETTCRSISIRVWEEVADKDLVQVALYNPEHNMMLCGWNRIPEDATFRKFMNDIKTKCLQDGFVFMGLVGPKVKPDMVEYRDVLIRQGYEVENRFLRQTKPTPNTGVVYMPYQVDADTPTLLTPNFKIENPAFNESVPEEPPYTAKFQIGEVQVKPNA